MLFKYSGFDKDGNKIKSKVEASSFEDAKNRLKAKGILYTSLKEDSFDFGKLSFKRKKKIDNLNLSYLSRDLSIYLNSGLTLISSISLLKQRYKSNKTFLTFFDTDRKSVV